MKRPVVDSRQIDLFTVAQPQLGPASFAGFEVATAQEVGLMLKGDERSREEVAGALSAAMGEDVSRYMLDAYASPGREAHRISFARAVALASVTSNFALIERAVHLLGGRVLWGNEIYAARRGHLQAQLARIKDEIKALDRVVEPIERPAAKGTRR